MNEGTRLPHDAGIDDGGEDEELLASGSITPDAFLAEVARIPGRRSPPTSDPPLDPGLVIGHFVIRRELGRGGMGVVYEAEDTALGRSVALKVLRADDEGRRRRFLREARSAALVSHPGIAVVYEIGEVAGRAFIAMELVRGETLRARLAGGPLPVEEARALAREIARALASAHERSVVHRDLKPENVMIGEEGQIKLLDFGLAKPLASDEIEIGTATTATEHGRVLGTPTYMSPEQAKGRDVDARSDVFSFGVMLYEMLTGQRPFTGGTVVELFIALDRDEPIPPSRRNPRVPEDLERVVLRCLQKDPRRRYEGASALLRDLEPRGALRRPTARRAWVTLAASAAIALGVGAAALRGRTPPDKPAAARTITDRPAPKSNNPEAIAAYRAGMVAMREGNAQIHGLRRAVELDPDLAAAHVQLATMVMGHATDMAREHFRKASARRAELDPKDAVILDAIEPLVQRQPADWAETNRRLEAAIARFPGDAELWHLLARGRANYDDFEAAVAHEKQAIALDPGFADGWSAMAMYLAYLGRFGEARVAVQQGLAITPNSLSCMQVAATIHRARGECAEMESMSRRMIAAGVPPQVSYHSLAEALAGRASLGSVREALKRAEQGVADLPAGMVPETVRKQKRLGMAWALAMLEGDFESAERVAGEYLPTLADSTAQMDRGGAAWALAELHLETGRVEDAGRVALEYLEKRDAWEPAPGAEDVAMATDATPFLLLTARRTGVLSRADFEAHREAFRRTWKARMTPVTRPYLWVHGHAAMVEDEGDARDALAALPEYLPVPPFQPESRADAEVGRTYLLAGRVDEAIAWLERASTRCGWLQMPPAHVRVLLALGDARAQKGDIAGACAAYGGVLSRWDKARPRSVSVERARAQRKALGCGI